MARSRRRRIPSRGRLDSRWHLVSLAIFTRQKVVGSLVAEKALGTRIESQVETGLVVGPIQRHTIVAQVFLHACEGFEPFGIIAKTTRPAIKPIANTEPIADVAQVAQGAGQVAFENVRMQVLLAARADGGHEIADVRRQWIAGAAEAAQHFA